MSAINSGLATGSSLDGLLVDDTDSLGIDANFILDVASGGYGLSPYNNELLSGTEPLMSGTEALLSVNEPYSIKIFRKISVKPGRLLVYGKSNDLHLDANDTTLNIGGGNVFATSLDDAYDIHTNKRFPVSSTIFNVNGSEIKLKKTVGVLPGVYNYRKRATGLAVDYDDSGLLAGEVDQFVPENYNLFDISILRKIPVNTGVYSSAGSNVGIVTRNKISIDTMLLGISSYNVGIINQKVTIVDPSSSQITASPISITKQSKVGVDPMELNVTSYPVGISAAGIVILDPMTLWVSGYPITVNKTEVQPPAAITVTVDPTIFDVSTYQVKTTRQRKVFVNSAPFSITPYQVRTIKYGIVPVNPGSVTLNTFQIGIRKRGGVTLDPMWFDISSFPIGIDKENIFVLGTGKYELQSFVVNVKKNSTFVEGRYIVDSANYYTLYVDQGLDYQILIDTEKLGFISTEGVDFRSEFAKHPTSINKYTIECIKLTPYLMKIRINPSTTADLMEGRYIFNITATRNGTSFKVIDGAVILKGMVRE